MFSLKTFKLAFLISVGSVLMLQGCSINEKIEQDKNAVAQQQNVMAQMAKNKPKYERVTVKSHFYVPPLSEKEAAMPDWYFDRVDAAYSGVPFSLIVSELVKGKAITPDMNELSADDLVAPISIAFNDMRLGEALRSLAKTAGYVAAIQSDAVIINKYQEATFTIATLPGQFNSQIGNDGEVRLSSGSQNDSNASTSASMEAGNRQYSSLTIKDQSLMKELKTALEHLKTSSGKVEVAERTGTIFVKDRPFAVQAIAKVIDDFNRELTKTVALDIRLLDVIYTTNNRSAFDYKIAANLLDGKAILKSNGTSFVAGSGTTPAPGQFDLSIVGGDLDGTKLFIDALQKQADISREIVIPAEMANGTMAKVMAVDNTMFVAEQYGNNATTGGVLTGGGARQETLQTGQIVNVFARAVGDDVLFKINASISAKLDIKKKNDEAAGLYLESPETTAMIFDHTGILENGVTRIITGINAESVNVSDSNAGYDVLGFARTSETVKKETIMVITARVTRGLTTKPNYLGAL